MPLYYIQRATENPYPMQARLATVCEPMHKVAAMEKAERLAGEDPLFFTDGPGVMGYRGGSGTYLVIAADTHIQAMY